MSELETLLLNDNDLTEFPDLSNVTNGLTELSLHDNEIDIVPDDRFGVLTNLQSLTLGRRSGQAIYLPNVCVVDTSNVIEVTIYTSPIHCDEKAIIAKWAQTAGRLSLRSSTPVSRTSQPRRHRL